MRAIGYGAFALAGLLACSSTSGDGNGASTAQDASAGDGSLGGGHPGGDASIANGDDGGTGGDVDNAADGVGGALKPPPAALNWTYLPDTSQVSVLSIWGSGPNDVYIVGLVGMGDHFDGAQWTSLDTGTGAHLKAVWGSGPNDVYIATESNA